MNSKNEGNPEDFIESITQIMQEQEAANPEMVDLHERLSPEYQEIKSLIQNFLSSPAELKQNFISQIRSYEIKALLPLIDTLASIDRLLREGSENL